MISRIQCALIFLAGALLAQQPMPLTLTDAQRLAIQNNPRFSAAKLNASAAHQIPAEYRANFFPTATGSMTGVGADSGSRIAAGSLSNSAIYNRLGTGITVSQMFTDFGRTRSLVESSNLKAQAQDQAAEATRSDILLLTARSYFAVLRAQAVLDVARKTVGARQLVSEQVTALEANRLKSTLDVSFANVNLADARLLLAQAENDSRAAQADLATAIGLPAQTSFTLSEEALPTGLPDQADNMIQEALQNRPELKDLRLQQSAAERFAKAEHALFYPTIGAIGAAGVVPAAEQVVPGRYGAVGLNVSIPVFNGGLFKARQKEAELRAQAATQNINDLANRVTRDVRVAFLAAQNAYQRLSLTDQLLKQAQLALELAQTRYDLGLSSIVELSQAQLNLTSAEIGVASAKYDYQSYWSLVQYQIGALR